MANKKQKRNEFRKNKKSGHPAYIFQKIGNDFEFIGITHSEITQGTRNIKLDVNPDPGDNRTAYIRPKAERQRETKFSNKRLEHMQFDESDLPKVEAVKQRKSASEPCA